MKQFLLKLHDQPKKLMLIFIVLTIICFTACRKSDNPFRGNNNPAFYSADVIDKWFTLEIRFFKDATGIGNGAFARPFAYSGICAYESIDPGLASWKNKYNGLSGLPETEKNKRYDWSASVNASLAEFNRNFFTTANLIATDLAAFDSFENPLYSTFSSDGTELLNRSVGFGKSIADAVFAWSLTDSYIQNNAMPY